MNEQRLFELIDALLETRITDAERDELSQLLRESPAAQDLYRELIELDVMLRDTIQVSLGDDLARPSSESALSRDEASDESVVREAFAVRTNAELRRYPSSWLAGLMLLTLIGLIGWGIGDWRRHVRPVSFTPQRPVVATLRGLEGAAWRVSTDSRETKIATGQVFSNGDTIRVGESSTAELTLADGSRLELRASAVLRFPAKTDSPRGELYLSRGGIDVSAVRQPPERPLVIATVAARLTVLGTQFRLYANEEDSRVELIEGKVRFERRVDGRAVDVAAGQYAIASTRGSPAEPLVARALEDTWRLRHTIPDAGALVAFSRDGVWLATASYSQVEVWDVASGEPCYQHPTAARFDELAFTPDHSSVVALSHQGSALHWRFADDTVATADLIAVAGKMRQGAVSRDGRWLAQATGAELGYLAVWSHGRDGVFQPLPALPMKAGGVAVATPAGGGPLIVACDELGTVVRWEAATGLELARFRLESPLHLLDVSADGRWLAGYGNRAGLVLLDMGTGAIHELWPASSVKVYDVHFTPQGGSLYAAMADGVARAWSTADAQPLLALATGDPHLRSIDISSDGQWLAVAGDRDRVTLWQVEPKGPTAAPK